jgi:hypothetical protein
VPFTDRFQLLDLKRDEGARTYEAREIATGRPVYVHLFADPFTPFNRALLAKLETLPEEERRRILDRGPHEGGLYLVTDRLAEYPGLREWLKAKNDDRPNSLNMAGAWQVKPIAPPPAVDQPPTPFDTAPLPTVEPSIVEPPPVSTLGNSGEQTLQMPAPAVDLPTIKSPVVKPVAANDTPAPPKEIPAPPASEPGEFTRQFAPPVLRPTPPPAAPPPKDPGEFTRLFAATPPKSAQPPTRPPTGEFTRQFQAPQRPGARAGEQSPPPPRAPAPPQQDAPGEFTQMLQAQRPGAPAPPANQLSQSGEFTRFFQSPMTPSAQQPQGAPLTPPRPPVPSKDAGEFTQVFGKGDMPSAPPPPAPAAPPNPASSNATQVFAAPRPLNTVPMAAQNTPAPPQQRAPGEYTQMFAKPASLTFGQAPAGPQSPRIPESAPVKRNKSLLPLLLVIGAAALLIAAAVIYLLMRHTT